MSGSEKERRNRIADMVLERFMESAIPTYCSGRFDDDDFERAVNASVKRAYLIADAHIAAGNETVSDDGSDA